jgi:hypothetical protein
MTNASIPNAPISKDEIEAKYGTSRPEPRSNPYFRTLAILATLFLGIGLVIAMNGEVFGMALLGVGFSTLLAALIVGALTWQMREANAR